MNRRTFLSAVTGGLLAAPLAAEAQQAAKSARIGYVTLNPISAAPDIHAAFRDELRQLGYAEGRNLIIEYRTLEGKLERIPRIAVELTSLGVDVILAANTVVAVPLVAATERIPVVVAQGGDFIGSGLAATLAKPGGRVTGLSMLWGDMVPKRIEFLSQAVPELRRVVVVVQTSQDPTLTAEIFREVPQAAKQLPVAVSVVTVDGPASLEKQIVSLAREKRVGMVLTAEVAWWPHRARIAGLVVKHRLPAIYDLKPFAEGGFLMSYGPDVAHLFRQAAIYVAKILQGAKVGDLPIAQPTKFELVINLKTAKALGLTIPQSLLLRADQVIE